MFEASCVSKAAFKKSRFYLLEQRLTLIFFKSISGRFFTPGSKSLFLLGLFVYLIPSALLLFLNDDSLIFHKNTDRYVPAGIGLNSSWGKAADGSQLPMLINYIPCYFWGYTGFAIVNILAIGYALGRLLTETVAYLNPAKAKLFVVCCSLAITLFAYAANIGMMLISEPGSMAALILIMAVALNKRITVFDCLFLLAFSGYHRANFVIILLFTFSLIIFEIFCSTGRKNFLALGLIILCSLLSQQMDNLLYKNKYKNQPRMDYVFLGAVLLNFYEPIDTIACQENPGLAICRPQTRDFINKNRNSWRYDGIRLLWDNDRIFRGSPENPPDQNSPYILLSDFEASSKQLIKTAIAMLISHPDVILEISTKRIIALFKANHSHHQIPFMRKNWIMNSINKIKFAQFWLLPLISLLLLISTSYPTRLKVWRFLYIGFALYAANLIVLALTGTAMSRYHHRCFFPITLMLISCLWLFCSNVCWSGLFDRLKIKVRQ